MIPRRFVLANRGYKVFIAGGEKFNAARDRLGGEGPSLGMTCSDHAEIWLHSELHKTRAHLEHTFFHELMHALLYARGIQDHDEEIVDGMAALLHQFMLTRRGEQ